MPSCCHSVGRGLLRRSLTLRHSPYVFRGMAAGLILVVVCLSSLFVAASTGVRRNEHASKSRVPRAVLRTPLANDDLSKPHSFPQTATARACREFAFELRACGLVVRHDFEPTSI